MKLFYREIGSGSETLLILHGLFGLSDNWVSLARRYAEKYRVIVPDLRNHGQTMHSDVFTYEAMLADIEEFVEDLELPSVNILGHSMGGKLAMQFALRNSYRVDKLIVADISPVPYPPTRHVDILETMKSIDFSAFDTRTKIEQYLFNTMNDAGIVGLLLKNITRLRDDRFAWKLNIEAISENIAGIFDFYVFDKQVFKKPTLFIKGSLSDFVKDDHLPAIQRYFSNYRLETIENATHWLHAEQPDAFFELTYDFLKR